MSESAVVVLRTETRTAKATVVNATIRRRVDTVELRLTTTTPLIVKRPGTTATVAPQQTTIVRREQRVVLEGPVGAQGPQGRPGPSEDVFIQPTAPTPPGFPYLWIQTQIGADNDMTFWVEDGT